MGLGHNLSGSPIILLTAYAPKHILISYVADAGIFRGESFNDLPGLHYAVPEIRKAP